MSKRACPGDSRKRLLILTSLSAALLLSCTQPLIAFDRDSKEDKGKSKETEAAKGKRQETTKKVVERLPRNVLPDTYRIFIEPDIENKQFSGEETIFLTVNSSTKDIVLNSLELDIAEVEVSSASGKGHGEWVAPERTIYDKHNQQVCFRFQQNLKPGKYELRLKFGGKLNDKLTGFYLSTFVNDKGEKRTIASTQMEATDARKVFPCFDEPDMKATFKVTLAVDPELTAISNGPVQFDKLEGRKNKRQITFAETPKMSTYLVAFVVGPFESSEEKVVNGVAIKVWATPGNKDQCGFALDAASKMLPYYENYFGVKYPLEKLDLIAIPDFGPGAMENLGAVTFRETRLLVDDKTATTAAKQEVASVIAHEMAHMWFGDLVTMKWWDDIWLNEAFATWMSVKAMENYKPEWNPWDIFTRDRAPALASDSLVSSTRPIYTQVDDPAEIEEVFDEITYEKGASVLRMLEKYLGEDVYMKGIQKYIKDHQFGNAETKELWLALQQVSNQPVADIMQQWVYTPGYPLVKAELSKSQKLKDGTPAVTLTQTPFSISDHGGDGKSRKRSSKNSADKSKLLWQIPISCRMATAKTSSSCEGEFSELLVERKRTSDRLFTSVPWLINANADGFFRVSYPASWLDSLGKCTQTTLNPAERYQLLNDAWALVEAGELPVSKYLEFTAYYKDESDPNVIELFVSQIATLDWFVTSASRSNFALFVRDRFGPLAHKLGWEPNPEETDLTQVLRGHVLCAMGTYGQDPATISEARKYWDIYMEKPEEVNPNLYKAIVAIVAYNGDEHTYKEMEQLFRSATTPEAKLRNLGGLAFFRKPELQKRTLELALTDDVKTQDAPHVVLDLLKTSSGRELGWSFVKQHWKEMEARYPVHLFPRIVNGTTSFVSNEQAKDLEHFLAENPIKSGKRVAGKAIERVRSNVKLNERNAEPLESWLKDFKTRENAALPN